jgi:cytochrome P450 family 135
VLAGGGSALLEPFAGPSSVLVLDGAEHLRARRLMLPAFHGDRMRAHAPMVAALAAAEIDTWPRGTAIATHPRMQSLTLEIMLRVVFGARGRGQVGDLREAIERALAIARSAPRLVAMTVLGRDAPFRRAVEGVDRLLLALIARRRADREAGRPTGGRAVLDDLLDARGPDGATPDDRELRDHLVTLLAAGHETTASALAWAFERLARHPGVVERLREGDEALLDATVREVLRVRPVLSIAPREVVAPFEVEGGWTLPPGVQVAACILLAHRRTGSFGADALAFRPARWLEGDPPPAYAWIPFGGGARRCLGAAFAQMEMREILRVAVARLDLRADRARGERVRRRAVSLTPARRGRVVA